MMSDNTFTSTACSSIINSHGLFVHGARQMASSRLLFTCITALFFYFLSPSDASSSYPHGGRFQVSAVNSQKVNLSLYYDTLCPSCATFIVKNLYGIFDKDLITIINLRLVPWGKANVNKSNNAIVCQHGPDECLLNTLQACAINVFHDVNKHYALIHCFEFLVIEGRQKNWESCFDNLGLPKKAVLECYVSGNGTKLIQKYADETAHLNPSCAYVPWLVVNNRPLKEDYQNFVAYVCKAYKGNGAPTVCKQSGRKIN